MSTVKRSQPYTVALDAMGGDLAPAEPVRGAISAAKEHGVRVLLVGDTAAIQAELDQLEHDGLLLDVVPSEGVIREGEPPARSLRAKPKASVVVATQLVRAGKADALVTMGSTGAAMASSVLAFGLFPGLERPALGGPFISLAPKTTIMDLGAQIDCRPSQLLSFAALGCTFSRIFLKISNPRVGLLSVGAEEGKGNRQVQEAYPLLKGSGLNFVGNVEGHEIFLDRADVLVCDGFVGNVLLKFTEGLAHAAAQYLRSSLGPDSPAARRLEELASAAESAGGPLFGVNADVIIGHGRSKADGIANSIGRAKAMLDLALVDAMQVELASVLQRADRPVTTG
jgi:glycerol-3-phosphate acyltransferase PlsX